MKPLPVFLAALVTLSMVGCSNQSYQQNNAQDYNSNYKSNTEKTQKTTVQEDIKDYSQFLETSITIETEIISEIFAEDYPGYNPPSVPEDYLQDFSSVSGDIISIDDCIITPDNTGRGYDIRVKITNLTDQSIDMLQLNGRLYDNDDIAVDDYYDVETTIIDPYTTIWLNTWFSAEYDPTSIQFIRYQISQKHPTEANHYLALIDDNFDQEYKFSFN